MRLFPTVALVAALSLWATVLPGQATPFYDLNSDWSNTANPNGPWAYYGGTTLLPYNANWTPGPPAPGGGCPAFAPGSASGSFLPVIFGGVCLGYDVAAGVVTHTWDYANGAAGYYPDNVVFTAPFAGTADINGSLQMDPFAAATYRPQDWYLIINGGLMASGILDDTGAPQAETFDFQNVSLYAGEPVELEMIAEGLGTFIDINMAVDYVPEPSTLALFGTALIGFGAVRRRARR